MFTPPPSPLPSYSTPGHVTNIDRDEDSAVNAGPALPGDHLECKRMTSRKTKWTIVLVPLVLVLITASTRFITHPVMFDFLSKQPTSGWRSWPPTASMWRPHEQHPYRRAPTASLSSLTFTTTGIEFPTAPPTLTSQPTPTLTSTAQSLPTIPSSPPVLPAPFPQPLDTFQNNFSSVSCYNFFLNMTNTVPFRACRPFSLLQQSSEAFIQAQDNATLLNDIIWGTCNTQPGVAQCTANMAWFSSALQSSCADDLSQQNEAAVSTLVGLQAFALMYNTGCLADPTTDAYCYVSAAINPNPSDLYFYQLPLGIALPNSTKLTCSGCTKSLLSMYDAALGNSTEAAELTGLHATYSAAANIAGSECGQGYAMSSVVTGAAVASRSGVSKLIRVVGSVALVVLGGSLLP